MKNVRYDKIGTYFKLNIGVVILLSITAFLFNVSIAFVPTFQGYVIDALKDKKEFSYVLHLSLYYLAFVLFVQLNRFLKRLFRRRLANKIILQMRTKAFSNLLIDDINKFDFKTYGDIMNKQLADIRDAAEAFETLLAETFDSGVLLAAYFIFMGIHSWPLATVCMIFPVIVIFISVMMGPKIRKFTREYKEVYSDTKEENITVLQNEIYYRGFGINKNYYYKYEETLDSLEKRAVKNTIYRTSFEPLYLGIAALGYIFAFYYGGLKVIDGIWKIGTLTAFISSFTFARKKCGFVGRIINNIQNGFVSWERCKSYMVTDIKQENIEALSNDGLEVKDLSFGYDSSFKLNDINFNASYGDIISVCGRIRSGKTTLAGALSGIYDYDGSIKLAGLELKDIRNDKIKSFIHYAPGKVEIFNDTLKYNITFGNDGDFNKAIETACLDDDINQFPNKEEEVLSHSLLNISGGQQRRLQIARCVFNSPKLVILDDPFNAIGHSMSIKIIENIKANYPNTIFVIINNQRDTLKLSDKILYLEHGSSTFASFDELLNIDSFKSLVGGDV